jgi:hypothetical protein
MDMPRKRPIMKSLLLLDTDVVVGCHKLGYWKGILSSYSLHVGPVVVDETKHYYDKDGNKVDIDLRPYLKSKEITEISVSLEEIAEVLKRLSVEPKLSGTLHDGELEGLTITGSGKVPGLKFCLIDQAAIKAVPYLGLEERVISLEQALLDRGIIRPTAKIPTEYTKKRFEKFMLDGAFYIIKPKVLNDTQK